MARYSICKECKAFFKKYPLKKHDGKMVHEIEKNYYYEKINCAFKSGGPFGSDNWNCMTMNKLRDLEGTRIGDNSDNVVYVIPRQYGFIILAFYKNRGRVDAAYELTMQGEIFNLRYDVALEVIKELGEINANTNEVD